MCALAEGTQRLQPCLCHVFIARSRVVCAEIYRPVLMCADVCVCVQTCVDVCMSVCVDTEQ